MAKAFDDARVAEVATVAHSKVGSAQGSTLKKPQGSKAAKCLKLVKGWRKAAEEKRLAECKEANKSLQVIGGAQDGMTSTFHMQDESETRTHLISIYLHLGQSKEVLCLMQEEEALLEEKKQARLARAEHNRKTMLELQTCAVTTDGAVGDNIPQDIDVQCGSPN